MTTRLGFMYHLIVVHTNELTTLQYSNHISKHSVRYKGSVYSYNVMRF